MNNGQLFLFPTQPINNADDVINTMSNIGLIDQVWNSPNRWLAGDNFLKLITFLGCSPYIEFVPPDSGNENFCFIQFNGIYDQRKFYFGKNVRPPQCPSCFAKTDASVDFTSQTLKDPEAKWQCDQCQTSVALADLNWRKQAGAANATIMINSVFPSEAIPSNELLNALKEHTATDWKYFYVQQ